ncbi:MAG: hypothetical protein WC604_04540 [Candidatus Gracilibacteria bacterium]
MKKIILSFLVAFSLVNAGLAINFMSNGNTALAAPGDAPGDAADTSGDASGDDEPADVEVKTHLPIPDSSKYFGLPNPAVSPSGQEIAKIAIESAIKYGKILAAVIAVLFIIIMGAKYVTSGGDEEAVKKSSKGLLMSILALAIISLSGEVAEIVGFYGKLQPFMTDPKGGILDPEYMIERVGLFDKRVEVIMVFIKYFIGSLAVLMLVINGVKLVVGGGEEESVKKARNGVIYSLLGLIILLVANTFVENVFYTIDKDMYSTTGAEPTTSIERGIEELTGITNLVVSFVGPLLLLLILVGGIMYLTAGGEEEKMNKAKRLLIAAVIGVIVIYGAFAIVSTLTTGYFSKPAKLQEYPILETELFLYPFNLLK